MSIITLPVGDLLTNCYFLIDDASGKAFVIDPGAEPEKILSQIRKAKIKVAGIINTHGHADHIAANSSVKKEGNPPIYIHGNDAPMLTNAVRNLSAYMQKVLSPEADIVLKDGDTIALSDAMKLKVIHTPGHTQGSICLLLEGECLFSGDTLFHGDVGRCDLPGGDEQVLAQSLKKLVALPPGLPVLPGHEEPTTIGEELKNNPWMRSANS